MTARLSYLSFLRDLGVKPTPAQRVTCAIAFDGVAPRSLRGANRDLSDAIFGPIDSVPPEARHVFVAVCGARAGKSYIFGALRLLHLALTSPLDTLAPGELASGLIVAPDLRLARQTLRYALGAANATKAIASRITAETSDSFVIRREAGRSVTLECLPATRGGSAVRGRSLVGAVLDESAFFRDENYTVNDGDLFRAIAPRIMPEGQIIIPTTPWVEAGLVYELFEANHGDPQTALVAHAPTVLLRDDARTRSMVARETTRDPDNAAREFGAEFMTGGAGLFLDSAAVDSSVDEEIIL